jgi:hypothetical protein
MPLDGLGFIGVEPPDPEPPESGGIPLQLFDRRWGVILSAVSLTAFCVAGEQLLTRNINELVASPFRSLLVVGGTVIGAVSGAEALYAFGRARNRSSGLDL